MGGRGFLARVLNSGFCAPCAAMSVELTVEPSSPRSRTRPQISIPRRGSRSFVTKSGAPAQQLTRAPAQH